MDNGNCEGWPLQLAPQMGMAIVFARVFGVVLPIGFGRNGGIPKVLCVRSNARLVFDDHDAGRGVFNKERQGAVHNSCLVKDVLHRWGEVFDLRISMHGNLEGMC